MQNNLLAFCQKADVIWCVGKSNQGNLWANQSTRISLFQLRRLRASTVTAVRNSAGLLRLEESKLGAWAILGSQRENLLKNTCAQILKLAGPRERKRRTHQRNNRSNILLEYSTNVLYYLRRDGEVLEHSSTAKPSATVEAVARDLFRILSTLCGCASSVPRSVSLAHSVYVLRRFAFNCKEGARHG